MVTLTGVGAAWGEDWPTYRHDIARSGITSESVRVPLQPCWAFRSPHRPRPAWGDPKPDPVEGYLELRRVHFDDVFHVVTAEGAVFFGSSASGKVYCLDTATGRVRWTMITGGPIRLAPTVAHGGVFFGSDDGYAYCLNAEDGSLRWRFRAAPEDQRVLGHGKMISLWPLRSGVLVDDGVAYFAAGIFPAEGVFLYAVDAQTGREIWRNDTCGENPQSKVSPQGYLLASPSTLYAPMGRVSPAAFDRRSGQLKYLTFFGKSVGGTYALVADEHVYTGTEEMVAYDVNTRDRFAVFNGRKLVVAEDTAYVASETELSALNRKTFPAASRKVYALRMRKAQLDRELKIARRQQEQSESYRRRYAQLEEQAAALNDELEQARREFAACARWTIPSECHDSLILAGNTLIAGGTDQVMAVEATSGSTVWTGQVEGIAKGLAAADGRLLVSTDKGVIYCFAPEGCPQYGTVTEPVAPNPFAGSKLAAFFEQAADAILRETGIRRGFCLVVGCETGGLAAELAKRSDLMIYAVDPDAANVAAARNAIDAAGLYGARVCVEQWPFTNIPYSDYFANLIVSETALLTGQLPLDPSEIVRVLKPCGGTLLIGQPEATPPSVKPLETESLRRWLEDSPIQPAELLSDGGTWAKLVRGPLPGAGDWTHQYANAANTACGDDQIVQSPLGVLWFGHPGPGNMVNRHRRAAGPLSLDGRLFIQGENVVMAYDIYNGLKLWERDIPGAMRINASHDGSNLAISRQGLFVAVGEVCLRLDTATGQTVGTYHVPPAAAGGRSRWGYVAVADGILYGSRGTALLTSQCLFAIDLETGETRWIYEGKRVSHNSVAIGDGRIYFVDTDVTAEQRKVAIEHGRLRISQLPENEQAAAEKALRAADVRLALALDAQTGELCWRQPVDLTHCGGGNLAAMYAEGVLVFFGVYLDGHYWQEFFAGEFASRRVTALSAEDGRWLWSRAVGYRVRPLIVGNTLHAEPWAFDLHTGEPKTRIHPVTGQTDRWQFARPGHHCGGPSASPHCLFFRSYCLGYYDLLRDSGTMHFGAQRPGCWINAIPSGGLLLVPEASAGCMCPFPNMCSVVFKPQPKAKGFAYYSAPGEMTPVQRLAINFGAPGDRLDAQGNLWLAYPRPSGSLVLGLNVDADFYRGGSFVQRNSAYTPVAGTDEPWLFASAAQGLRRCEIPLLGEADGTALYRVRLAMADPANDRPGRRRFDVKLQGKKVLEDFDIVRESGGRDRAVFHQFRGVEVRDKLVIELLPEPPNSPSEGAPILQGVEIVRQRFTELGCAVPDFLLNHREPKRTGQLRLANLCDDPFEGILRVAVPEGLDVVPERTQLKLASGDRMTIPLSASVSPDFPPGVYPFSVRLVRSDGTVRLQRNGRIEHLGSGGRLVLHPIEDASVSRRLPDGNKGSAPVLLVDGGNQTMGDEGHGLAYLKFSLDIPGTSRSVRLRIHNAGNPSGDAGRVCLVDGDWSESKVTYKTRPATGRELGRLGRVAENQSIECPLELALEGKTTLSLVIDPTSCDGVDYLSRESEKPVELVVQYEPK